MTKYTKEEIIDYLKTLREGDVLTAVQGEDGGRFFKGSKYDVKKDCDGDLHVTNERKNDAYVHIGFNYDRRLADMFECGVFEIPKPAIENETGKVVIYQKYQTKDGLALVVHCDEVGCKTIESIADKSAKQDKLNLLRKEVARLEEELAE